MSRNSSSSASTLSSFAPSCAEPRLISTGGLGGATSLAGGASAVLSAGFIDGIGADPSGDAGAGELCSGASVAGAGSSTGSTGAEAKDEDQDNQPVNEL